MSDPVRWTGQMPSTPQQGRQPARQGGGGDGTNLADILERVLDKGIVIAGDVQINLLDIELLTIKLRLVVASVDRAKEMGIDWWERDPTLSSGHQELEEENRRLRERLEALEGRNGHAPAALDRDEEDTDEADDLEDAGKDPEDEDDGVEPDDGGGPRAEEGAEREPSPAPRRATRARSGQQRSGGQRRRGTSR
jgi:hypothetical protein